MSTPNPVPTTASWTDPTANVDGSPIAPGEIISYTVGVRDAGATGTPPGTYPFAITAPATATSVLLASLNPHLPTGVTLAAAARANTAGPSSDWTPEVTFTLPAPLPVPNPPTVFTVA